MARDRKPKADKPPKVPREPSNFIAEWFGHRVYPVIAATDASLADQQAQRCPFLSATTDGGQQCIKAAKSAGVCTINTRRRVTKQRVDWLACPVRALGNPLLDSVVRRLFLIEPADPMLVLAAPALAHTETRDRLAAAVTGGTPAVVYIQNKFGGEISVAPTDRSPELSFDTTLVEIVNSPAGLAVGRYGILELQTMDFHGSYQHAVKDLQDALRLHEGEFHAALATKPQWLSNAVEGPNMSNVFKRTFYQMVLKFRIGAHESCVGCVLAIPTSVWQSWQRHLGRPTLIPRTDGTFAMTGGGVERDPDWKAPAWIYTFDIEQSATISPNPIVVRQMIATDADAMAYHALKLAPDAAVEPGGSVDRVLTTIYQRLNGLWPLILPRQVGS